MIFALESNQRQYLAGPDFYLTAKKEDNSIRQQLHPELLRTSNRFSVLNLLIVMSPIYAEMVQRLKNGDRFLEIR